MKKILAELQQIRALAATLQERSYSLEKLLVGGEGKKSLASTRKGRVNKLAAALIANRNRTIARNVKGSKNSNSND